MVSSTVARTIAGGIGNAISFGLFVSPVPTFWKIIKAKSVGDFSPNPYLTTLLNCLLWVYYGLPFVHANSVLVITINGFGIAIEVVYIIIFYKYAPKKQRGYMLKVLAGEIIFYAAIALLLTFETHVFVPNRPKIIGSVCDIVNIMMYAMPLDNLRLVISTKSSESLPPWLLLFNFLNGGFWLTYGLIPFDIFLVVSNGLGFALGFIQIIVWFIYRKPKTKDEKEASKIAAEKELSMV